ncbi:MAG: dihydrodipicolinate synthase family protein [Burkholderiaceae bacterium]|nr:MAG: dihydrodipicolinate synthase family protein [Burkholderiaceae bacterium]
MPFWRGVFPAITTPFTDDDRIDHAQLARQVEFQLGAGVNGLIVCGSLGEASTLSLEEKREVLAVTQEAAQGRVPVLLTLAENATRDACTQASAAERMGADGLMVLPGLRYVGNRQETVHHYRTVCRASGLPIMVYNNPLAYGVDITPEMFQELADERTLVAIKESAGDIRRFTDLVNALGDRYALFCGVDNLAMEAQIMGAHGWVAGLVCAFPHETVAIFELVRLGRIEEALAIYRWFAPLLALDVSARLVQNIKLAQAMLDVGTEHVRAPRLPLQGAEREEVVKIVQDALSRRPRLPLDLSR